jgi:hypothetical protein
LRLFLNQSRHGPRPRRRRQRLTTRPGVGHRFGLAPCLTRHYCPLPHGLVGLRSHLRLAWLSRAGRSHLEIIPGEPGVLCAPRLNRRAEDGSPYPGALLIGHWTSSMQPWLACPCPHLFGQIRLIGRIILCVLVKRKPSTMKKTCQKLTLAALLAAVASLGLTACQKSEESSTQSDQPAKTEQPKKAEHPEHPK